jgi:hypothetical protein
MELNWDDFRKRTVYNAHFVEKIFFFVITTRAYVLMSFHLPCDPKLIIFYTAIEPNRRTGHFGNAVIAARLFFKNAFENFQGMWGFFKGFEAFSKI